MKTVITSVLLCAFLQVVWLSFSTGQTGSAANCTDYNGNSTTCCVNTSCIFFRCSESDSDGQCVEVASASPPPVCSGTGKPGNASCNDPNADLCTQHTDNETACCEDESCGFFFCNGTDPKTAGTKSCAKKNATDVCASGEQSNNTCSAQPTTSTAAPHTTTPGSDTCASRDSNLTLCCAAAPKDGCIFYMCVGGAENTTVCRSNKTGEEHTCSGDSKAVVIACTQTSTSTPSSTSQKPTTAPQPISTSQAPTQAPSGGSSGGGRHFDGASFIGGIVLCAGIVAIGYFGLKFYKSRQERNYHTL